MNKREIIQKQINYIMDTFEFGDVIKMMKSVNWRFCNDAGGFPTPTEYDVRILARKLMSEVGDEISMVSTGGFLVTYRHGVEDTDTDEDVPWVEINLMWGLQSSNEGESYYEIFFENKSV